MQEHPLAERARLRVCTFRRVHNFFLLIHALHFVMQFNITGRHTRPSVHVLCNVYTCGIVLYYNMVRREFQPLAYEVYKRRRVLAFCPTVLEARETKGKPKNRNLIFEYNIVSGLESLTLVGRSPTISASARTLYEYCAAPKAQLPFVFYPYIVKTFANAWSAVGSRQSVHNT